MAKKHGTALLGMQQFEVPQCLELASAVVAALPRDIDPDVAQGWIEPGNRRGLRKVLREALMPPRIAKSTKSITVPENWYNQLFQLVVEAGRFTEFCDANVTGEHFPYVPGDLDDDVDEREVSINHDMNTVEVRAFLERHRLEGASAFRLLRWWIRHPERQKDCVVVALGQEWQGDAVYVHGDGDLRKLHLSHVEGVWIWRCSFLAVKKKTAK